MNIGDRIKNRRLELNMTQDELAKKLGYKTRGSVTKIECGYQNLTQPKIVAMAKALDTTPAYLMGWEDNIGTTTTTTGNHNTTNTNNFYSDCGSSAKEAIEFIDKDSALYRIMYLLITHKKEFKRSDLEWIKQNIDFFLNEMEIPKN